MKSFHIAVALLLVIGAIALAEETVSVLHGIDSATATQSGPSGDTQTFADRIIPGQTRIEQRSGTNAAVIIQDSGATARGSIPDDLDDGPVATSKAGIGVYGVVRGQSSPQGRANLDRLMTILGDSA